MKVYQNFALLLALVSTLAALTLAQHGPRNQQHRNRPQSPGRNKKVKRHNLQRPVKPVYHSPPINAFSLKDLQKDEDEDFPPAPIRSPLTTRYSKPNLAPDGSNEELYFASLNDKFPANFGKEYFNPNPNIYKNKFTPITSTVHHPSPPKKKGNFGLYGPDFGSITDLYDHKETQQFNTDDEHQNFYAGDFHKPYQSYYHPTTTAKPKLLVPTYASLKPANIRHVGSSGYGYPNNAYTNGDDESYGHKDAHYSFGYEISNPGKHGHDPQVFGHGEQRDGDVTKGRYHVLLPDGRHQKVAYTADHSGYHAHVSYSSQYGYHSR